MSTNPIGRILGFNVTLQFHAWASGKITFKQFVYRAFIKPGLIALCVAGVLGLVVVAIAVPSWIEKAKESTSTKKLVPRSATNMDRSTKTPGTYIAPQTRAGVAEMKSKADASVPPANAARVDADADADACADQDCDEARLVEADHELNSVYKLTMSRLSNSEKTALRMEERRWIKERDLACGKFLAQEKIDCLIQATEQRTLGLEVYEQN